MTRSSFIGARLLILAGNNSEDIGMLLSDKTQKPGTARAGGG